MVSAFSSLMPLFFKKALASHPSHRACSDSRHRVADHWHGGQWVLGGIGLRRSSAWFGSWLAALLRHQVGNCGALDAGDDSAGVCERGEVRLLHLQSLVLVADVKPD